MARKPFLLRIDARLYEELRRWADAELRSVNGQVEYILRRAVEERKRARTEAAPRDAADSGGEKTKAGG